MLVLIVAFSRTDTTQAEEISETETYQLSEYDYYFTVRKMTFDEAEKTFGINKHDYETVLSIENQIVKLAAMNDSELYERGMTDTQINALRKYDGSKIEDNPQLRSVLATLSVSLIKVSGSSSAVTVRANWSWNSRPLVTSTTYFETTAFRWKAYNSLGTQITASYNSSGSYCYVTYYNGSTAQTTQRKGITIGNSNSYVYSQFTTDVMIGNVECWAKTGYMVVKVTGSYLSRIDFGFGYNHGISSTPTTITLDSNLGFNYSNGYEMAEQSISINV
ncbi:MAG: hypothetical protein IJG59_06420 [Erysipelotrichaceae bacterium]|nr:hypothetical protein [Erysipelotrichaceae bacterium]